MKDPTQVSPLRSSKLPNPKQLSWNAQSIKHKAKQGVHLFAKRNRIEVHTSIPIHTLSATFIYGVWLCFVPSVFCLLSSGSAVSVAATPQIAQTNLSTNINRPTLKLGSQGERVSELQAALKLLGFYSGAVDGVYNDVTANAVSKFKQSVGLNPDGIVDANTWQQLFPKESTVASPNSTNKSPVPSTTANSTKVVNPSHSPKPATRSHSATSKVDTSTNPEPKPATPKTSQGQSSATRSGSTTHTQPTARTQQNRDIQYTAAGFPILRVGMSGPEVVKLQQRLQKLGFFDGTISGHFGATTEAAVKALQKRYGLEADGVAGGETWEILTRRN